MNCVHVAQVRNINNAVVNSDKIKVLNIDKVNINMKVV
jgi:hypothetical protein